MSEVCLYEGVDGFVSMIFNGEIVVLHAGKSPVMDADLLFAARAEGRPLELTRPMARELAEMILRGLDESQPATGTSSPVAD